ncbi:hypothetical protein VP01_1154g3 [Puccinia sorghi]|uniref:HAT C-terminal dimerisation domain-containing protein n=1 Tax=Puccinia sorghi TaxID=27349 RepID=A0A0L6VRM9_9BASI|nr:hypothetical protein VP01_1154g3 [Puccinia sorghi]
MKSTSSDSSFIPHTAASTFPFNSKLFNCPLSFWLAVPLTPKSESLKKMAISILEIVPHAARVQGLFSLMNAMKTKARNRHSPNTLKMMAQIKLHLLQYDPLLGPRKSRKQKHRAEMTQSTNI